MSQRKRIIPAMLAAWATAAVLDAGAQVTTVTLPPLARGISGDSWADIELGQRDFTEVNEGKVTSNRLKLPSGVAIDRSVSPGRLYVWDAGNNRIVALDLATCYAGAGPCNATLVIGQPSLIDHGACNQDASFATYPERPLSSASTLCGAFEGTHNVLGEKTVVGLFADSRGDVWVPDAGNNRVLKFNSPFTSNVEADEVWGQADFTGNKCNRHTIFYAGRSVPDLVAPDATTLCFREVGGGVTLDAQGNLWVADSGNHRVLRFPNVSGTVSKTADLVIGQHDFVSSTHGGQLDQLFFPTQVRFDPAGNLLVLDSYATATEQSNARVMMFRPPFASGMAGTAFYSCPAWNTSVTPPVCQRPPVAIEVDSKRRGVWVVVSENNSANVRPQLYEWDSSLRYGLSELGPNGLDRAVAGSIALDGNGDLLLSAAGHANDVLRLHESQPGTFSVARNVFVTGGITNPPSADRVQHAGWGGVAIAGRQIIVADGRLLFWNDRTRITNGQAADGYVGGTSFTDVPDARFGKPEFGQVKTDRDEHVWVTHTNEFSAISEVQLYQGPLTTGAQPLKKLSTIPVLGGGSITLVSAYGIAPTAHSEFLWIAEPTRHHVIRVRGPLTANPVVDVILGQVGATGAEQCNQGLAPASSLASPALLCFPGAISLDRNGNLYVSDSFIGLRGNRRLLMFRPIAASTDRATVMVPAAKAFTTVDSFQFASFEPAFDSGNRMALGLNPVSGTRFVQLFSDPAAFDPANPFNPELARTDGFLSDFYGWPVGMTFDDEDNLYVYDANRKLLIYQRPLANLPRTMHWTLNAQIVCRNGNTPDQGLDAVTFMHATWPPGALQWSFAPANEPLHVQTTNPDNFVYVSLITDDAAAENLVPLPQQAHPAFLPSTYFVERVPMIKFAATSAIGGNPLPRGVYPVRFYAPDRWCGTSVPPKQAPAPIEVITFNHTYTARWQPGNEAGAAVRIELSIDNGATWTTIAASTSNDGAFALPAPAQPTQVARVRVTSISNPAISLVSEPFAMEPAASHGHKHHHHHHHHGGHDKDEHSEHEEHERHENHHDHDD